MFLFFFCFWFAYFSLISKFILLFWECETLLFFIYYLYLSNFHAINRWWLSIEIKCQKVSSVNPWGLMFIFVILSSASSDFVYLLSKFSLSPVNPSFPGVFNMRWQLRVLQSLSCFKSVQFFCTNAPTENNLSSFFVSFLQYFTLVSKNDANIWQLFISCS